MQVDLAQFHQTFFEESFEGLDLMESELLALTIGQTAPETINTIFRSAHSIKGGSATFGFSDVASFTHLMETLLDEMRDGRRQITQEDVNLLLQSVDCLREMLTAVQTHSSMDQERLGSLKQGLETTLKQGGGGTAPVQSSNSPSPSSVQTSSESLWQIIFEPHEDILRTGNDPVRMFRALEDLGKLTVKTDLSTLPPNLTQLNPEDCYLRWQLTLQGHNITAGQIAEVFEWVEDECKLTITNLTPEPTRQEPVAPPQVQSAPPSHTPLPQPVTNTAKREAPALERKAPSPGGVAAPESTSIRVNIDKIDALINMVGELVITQSMLGQMGNDFAMEKLELLREGLAQLERNTRELQESVMRIRMLPISFVFNRFPRMIHDLSQRLKKSVELKISGEQTELDKTVMEKIGDPLVHLVRNAVDHGIEEGDARMAKGKPEVGTVHLNAYHKGGNIVIEIKDDGKGINKEKVFNKAKQQGLIPDNDPITASDDRVYDFLFHPGFSTADQVSDISGRGVGLDVVRRNIKDLGGSVEIRSELGKGSNFVIRLPLTLAILDGQLVRVGSDTYVIPLVSIIETVQIRPDHINAIAGQTELYKIRGEYIPIIRLYEVFNQEETENTALTNGLLVVVEGDGQHAGLYVDDLLSQQQVVIKSLETNFKKIEGISGATILGDGKVALILDISGLLQLSNRLGNAFQHTTPRGKLGRMPKVPSSHTSAVKGSVHGYAAAS